MMDNKEKEIYQSPSAEIILFSVSDIITTSAGSNAYDAGLSFDEGFI